MASVPAMATAGGGECNLAQVGSLPSETRWNKDSISNCIDTNYKSWLTKNQVLTKFVSWQ